MIGTNVDVRVDCDAAGGGVSVTIRDARAEVLQTFEPLPERQRAQIAATAWLAGTAVVQQAQGLAAQARLEEVGRHVLDDVGRHLEAWTTGTLGRVEELLRGYFDPASGHVSQRIDQFASDDGELARLLRQHVAAENSTLARTLAERVGETSPLFRLLDPEQGKGLAAQIEARLKQALDASRLSLGEALNPRVAGSPIADFLADLRRDLKRTEKTQQERLAVVAAQLDANDESSLLSQLVRRTREAHAELRRAVNPEEPGSPLAIVRDTVTRLVREARDEQRQLIEATQLRQDAFQERVLALLTDQRATRHERAQGPRSGRDFEDVLVDFVTESVAGAAVMCDATGTRPGKIGARKVGDLVLRFTAESAFDGAGLVIEAKQDRSFNVVRALAELEVARTNRSCGAGLFVLAATHAPAGFPRFARFGSDVLVTWDSEDPEGDAYLHAAVQLGLALAARESGTTDPADLAAIADVEERIGHELRRLDVMEKHCDGIGRNVDKLKSEIGVARKKLSVLVTNARAALRALDATRAGLRRGASRTAEVALVPGSLARARAATDVGVAK